MTLAERYGDKKAIGVYVVCNWGGLEVLDVLYGIDDKLVTCFNFGDDRKHYRTVCVHTAADGRPYVNRYGVRYYLDEIMRV